MFNHSFECSRVPKGQISESGKEPNGQVPVLEGYRRVLSTVYTQYGMFYVWYHAVLRRLVRTYMHERF